MARKLPGGQHVVTGVDPVGPHGPHSLGEVVEAVATKMETSTPKTKGVLAIMCGSLLENCAGSTELREASIAEFQLDLHSATIAPT